MSFRVVGGSTGVAGGGPGTRISGRARFLTGDRPETVHGAGDGDFVWVPPHLRHVERNLSKEGPVRMVVARSTQKAIVVDRPTPRRSAHE